jgi:hypothetical protein
MVAKQLAQIENWAAVDGVLFQGFEPLEPGKRLMGYVFRHATLGDTSLIYTSPIVSINDGIVETANTRYHLGEPSPDYLNWLRQSTSTAA